MLEIRLCGGVEVLVGGRPLPESLIGGRQGRLALAYLACNRDRSVRREELADLLWADQLPDSWTASLSAVISRLRRLFTEAGLDGTSVVVSTAGAYQLVLPAGSLVDLDDLSDAVLEAEAAATGHDTDRAVAAATKAETIAARGFVPDDCEWADGRRDAIRDQRVRAAIALSAAYIEAGSPGRAIEAARHAVELDSFRESAYRQLMLALAAAGERAEALRVWERCRITLVEELGVDPSPETEAVYLELLAVSTPVAPATPSAPSALPSGVVTFLLTDIVESSALWEDDPTAMASALERHDAIVASVVARHGGALLKSKLEGDATVSVFARATESAAAALALLDAIESEPWPEGAHPRLRMAMHTGEAFERGGDYFGPALNRAARLRSLAGAGEVLLSQAVAELVRDHLPGEVVLQDRGLQTLRGLSRAENVFALSRSGAPARVDRRAAAADDEPARPPVPAALTTNGPFVGRGDELDRLGTLWARATDGERGAAFVGGEPGVGKSRLAGEIAQRVYADGGLVLYGRCDEDLAAPMQPFIEAVRALAPALGAPRLRAVRGVDELTRMVPELTEILGDKPGVRVDPDIERLALFDALTQLLVAASNAVPVLLVLDDLHWAGKTTLSLLRHLLRGTKGTRLLVIGTYRDTELARTHPLAETLADLRRDNDMHRIALSGLADDDVAAYLDAIGNRDRALGRELAEITAGNPFFLIEVVRHVEESGGSWQPGSLPEGVREATGRRLSRLSDRANDALAVAAVVGTTFDLALVEQVQGVELVDPIAEAVQAGLVIEEPGSFARFRFAHAIVRQVLLSELVSLKRVRLHRTIAELIEATPLAADPDVRLADLAYHWFECAAAGGADKAVDACGRAADRAMERLAYEEAGDLYAMALQALEWTEHTDADIAATLHLARCDALLTAGDLAAASAAIDALELVAAGSERLAAWYTTYEGLLTVLGEPDRLTEIVQSIGAAAGAMRDVGDLTGEAKARYVHASALERLGQIGDAERALDGALAAARTAGDQRLADAILAEAPSAALWGPSSVTRASGQCLDFVRVIRITSGTSPVEAVALRCQAVLEALRGRMDAARRMIGSARRTVEQFGLTLRRLETELAAGLIELLDGEAAAAEELLRDAYDGLRERGLDGVAAQAAAFLGRALLMQGRVDEADAVASEAEALAGADLKAAITWRNVRAEAAMRRGDIDRALTLAREAVDLANATDALVLVADARLTLATVLRAAGDDAAAGVEAQRAIDASEAKGATVVTALVRDTMGIATVASPSRASLIAPADQPAPNVASAMMMRFWDAFNRRDEPARVACYSPAFTFDDRRPLVGMTAVGRDPELGGMFARAGGQFDVPELLATRGDRIALARWSLRGPDMEVPFLGITRVDADALVTDFVMFAPEAMDEALLVFNEMASANVFANDATDTTARVHVGFNTHDWVAVENCYADAYTMEDRRPLMGLVSDREHAIATLRHMFEGTGKYDTRETVATRGRSLALQRTVFRVLDPQATVPVLSITEVDDACRFQRSVIVDPDDLDGALAELDRMFIEGEGAPYADVLAAGAAFVEELASFGDGPGRVEHIIDLSSLGGLWVVSGAADGTRCLLAVHVTHGDVVGADVFEESNIDAARASLDRGSQQEEGAERNAAWRAAVRLGEAQSSRDWPATTDVLGANYVYIDNRRGMGLRFERDVALDVHRTVLSIDDISIEIACVATRGERLVLTRVKALIVDGEAGPSEVETLSLIECGTDGQIVANTVFDPDDFDAAHAALDARDAELRPPAGNAAWQAVQRHCAASNRRDMEAVRASHRPDFVSIEYRRGALRLTGEDALKSNLVLMSLDEFTRHSTMLAVRGERLVLTRENVVFSDGVAGPAEYVSLTVNEIDEHGKFMRVDTFGGEDIEAAYAALDARHAELAAGTPNSAWHAALRLSDAQNQRDLPGLREVLDAACVFVDNRHGTQLQLVGAEALASYEVTMSIDSFRHEPTLIATRGDSLVLSRDLVCVVDGHAGPAEVEYLMLVECGPHGTVTRGTSFDAEELDAAYAALEARHAELSGEQSASVGIEWFENDAWHAAMNVLRAWNRRDWDGFVGTLDPDFVYADFRRGLRVRLDGERALESHKVLFTLDNYRVERELLATRGEHLVLTRDRVWFVDGDAGPAEVEALSVTECGDDGRVVAITSVAPDDIAAALDVIDDRYVELGGADFGVMRRSFDARDWDTFANLSAPDCTVADYRTAGWGDIDRDTFVDYQRSVVALAPDARLWIDRTRSRGNVSISTGRAFGTRDGGPWEIAFVTVGIAGADGASRHFESYELGDFAVALRRFDEFAEAPEEQPVSRSPSRSRRTS